MEHEALREPLSHVDAAWLRMDRPENPMVITSVLLLKGQVPFAAVEAVVRERLAPHPRFRQRAVEASGPLGKPHWEHDPLFDLRAHLHHMRLPAPAGQAEFEELIGDLMSTPLPRDRALWQAYFVDDVPSGSALVVRVHHSVGDGVALVRLLLSLCDAQGKEAKKPAEVGLKAPRSSGDLFDRGKHAAQQAATLGKLLLLSEDPPSILKTRLGTQKRCAWSEPIPLREIKRIAAKFGGTTNDVLQACVAGALRHYLLEQGTLPEREIRALVPVFLRDLDGNGLGNHFGLVFVSLPIGEPDPATRLRETKLRMDAIKTGDDATVAFAVLDAIGTASEALEHIALEVFTRKASLLTTNVPGPAQTCFLGGHELSGMLVWAPVSGYLGLGFTLISYAGSVRAGVSVDAHITNAPRDLVAAFEAELRALAAQA